jgi:hypothetical protein
VRTRTVEPPAQRKKVGIIKISVPARDGGAGGASRHSADDGDREVVDAGYGISPASEEVPADSALVPAAAEHRTTGEGAYAEGAHAEGGYAEGAYAENAYAENAYAENAYAENAYAENAYAENAYAESGYAESGYAESGYAEGAGARRVYGDSGAVGRGYDRGAATYSGGAYAEGAYAGNAYANGGYAGSACAGSRGGGAAAGDEWTDTDSHGFQRSRPLHPSGWSDGPAQDPWAEQAVEPVRAETGNGSAQWSGETGGWGDQAAWSTAGGGGAQANWGYHGGATHRGSGEYSAAQHSPVQQPAVADWDDETGFADQAAWGSARSPYAAQSSWGAYADWEPGAPDYVSDYTGDNAHIGGNAHTGDGERAGAAFGPDSREQAARDLAARGEAYRAGQDDGGEHRRHDDGVDRTGGDTRALQESAGGRHARQQPLPPGRRRAEDSDNVTSGQFTTGRHSERGWRSEDEMARQRTGGGINQGRFA